MMAEPGAGDLRADATLLRVEQLSVTFPASRGRKVHAVSDLSLELHRGETLGIVGESGCGKSTTGRAIVGLAKIASGRVLFNGADMAHLQAEELRKTRSALQMIFQDPISSLNPWRTILDIVIEPLAIWGIGTRAERAAQARDILRTVGLDPDSVGARRPMELSGGQCQRVSIARALILKPQLIICDEAVSALDVSVQAQIINLLQAMKARFQLSLLFISHDLAAVHAISDRIAVMYMGKICEIAPSVDLYAAPTHHYTALLLRSIPQSNRGPAVNQGIGENVAPEIPSPLDPPSGCRFRTRCPRAEQRCELEEPQLRVVAPDRFVACHFPLQHAIPANVLKQ